MRLEIGFTGINLYQELHHHAGMALKDEFAIFLHNTAPHGCRKTKFRLTTES